jgi:hypothetical protein
MDAKTYTLKVSEHMAAELTAVLIEMGVDPENISFREAYELILKKALTPPAPPVNETDEYHALKSRYEELQSRYEGLEKDRDEHSAVAIHSAATVEELTERADSAETALRESQEIIASLRAAIEEQRLPPNAFIIQAEPDRWQLLSETCERLREAARQYPRLAAFGRVTPATLLLYMFERYIVERRAEWFFPLSVMPAQRIKEIREEYVG